MSSSGISQNSALEMNLNLALKIIEDSLTLPIQCDTILGIGGSDSDNLWERYLDEDMIELFKRNKVLTVEELEYSRFENESYGKRFVTNYKIDDKFSQYFVETVALSFGQSTEVELPKMDYKTIKEVIIKSIQLNKDSTNAVVVIEALETLNPIGRILIYKPYDNITP